MDGGLGECAKNNPASACEGQSKPLENLPLKYQSAGEWL